MYYLIIQRSLVCKDTIFRFIPLLLISIFLVCPTEIYAQNAHISISVKNVSLKELLTSIEKQSDVRFSYIEKNLDHKKDITINIQDEPVEKLLDRILPDKGMEYTRTGNTIAIKLIQTQKDKLKKVSGTITDNKGEPIIGANVVQKGTTNGIITDIDGNFSLEIPEGATLVISYIGYLSQEIHTGNQSVFILKLAEDTQNLEEVVVVGYGVQKKINLTGSVENITGSDLAKKPVGQTSMALQGMSSGVTVQQTSGQPGKDNGTIRIRGIGTLSSANPLILVDGIESDINSVDPSDIKSISVLKDAASAAIYGSRAANGVILITTNRAEKSSFKINYDNYIGWQSPTSMPQNVSGYDHMVMINEANRNVGKVEPFTQEYIDEYRKNVPSDLYPETDWRKVMLKEKALQHNHHVSINGGREKVSILGSLSYLNQDGITINTNYERVNLRLNSDINLHKRLSANFDIYFMTDDNATPSAGMPWYFLNRYPNNLQGKNEDGSWGIGWDGTNTWAQETDGGMTHEKNYSANINFKVNYQPIDGLNLSFQYAPKWNFVHYKKFGKTVNLYYPSGDLYNPTPYRANMTEKYSKNVTNNLKALITYDKSFDAHNLSLLAGFEQIDFRGDWLNGFRDQYLLENYEVLNAGSPANQVATGSASDWALRSVFGRINYNYNQKYLLEANIRYDGSSRFATGLKYGVFPSFSAGWRISEESFMKDIEWINNLKIRASWGKLGNQDIGNYPFVSSVSLGMDYVFNGAVSAPGGAVTDAANPNITWESTAMTNIGFDATLFSKLSVTAEYYVKNTSDILLKLPIPGTSGLNPAYQNAGKVRNKGWDITLRYNDRIGDFEYGIGVNLSDVHNEITDLAKTGPYIYDRTIHKEGYPITSLYGLEAEGLFQNADEIKDHASQFGTILAPGDIKYKDQSTIDSDGDGIMDKADGVINADDRVITGDYMPHYTYGIDFYGKCKNIDLSFLLQGVGKADGYIDQQGVLAFYMGGTAQEWHKDHWTEENRDASYPRLTFNYPNNEQVSSYWIRNASYLRLKNLQVGYTVPNRFVKKIFLDYCRIFFSAQNLFTITGFYDGFDPEAPIGRGDFYPMMKVYSFGLNVKF